jgi:hypothetical protein
MKRTNYWLLTLSVLWVLSTVFMLVSSCHTTSVRGPKSVTYGDFPSNTPLSSITADAGDGQVPTYNGQEFVPRTPAGVPTSYALQGQVHGTTGAAAFLLGGDCPSKASDGGATLVCTKLTGADAGSVGSLLTVNANEVINKNVYTEELGPVATTSATPATMTWSIPTNTAGWFDVLVSCRQTYDAGIASGLAGGAKWSCGVSNHGGTCIFFSSCTAVSSWSATVDGGSSITASVSISSCVGTVTVTGAAGVNMDWAAVVQYASVQ